MSTPAYDRMQYLLKQTQEGGALGPNSSAYSALAQEGYGGAEQSSNLEDDPTSLKRILGYAASLTLGHYATTLGKKMEMNEVHHKAWVAFAAVYHAVARATDTQVIKEAMWLASMKPSNSWDNLVNSEGLSSSSAFGLRVSAVEGFIEGGHGEELERAFAVALVSIFAARFAVGENLKPIGCMAAYGAVFNWFNLRRRYLLPDNDENAPLMGLGTGGLERLMSDNYAPVFREINILSPQTAKARSTMFGFEDLTEVFQSPVDNQLEKDAELQVYKIEGEIHYDEWWWYNTPSCEDVEVPIENPQGKVTGYMNIGPISFPCVDESKNVTPITGTAFKRTFVEAPPVSGTYDKVNSEYIQGKTKYFYPTQDYGGDLTYGLEDYYEPADCRWITTMGRVGSAANHVITDSSNYEPYYFINNLENGEGSPFPGWHCKLSLDEGWCRSNDLHLIEGDCTSHGHEWVKPAASCIHPAPPPPSAFPNEGPVRDMSLRHSLRMEDHDASVNYWDDLRSWEWTGFVMAPLQFTDLRYNTLYKDHYSNPVLNGPNLGRRAFSFKNASTAQVVDGTCGPPQQFSNPNDSNQSYNFNGGPMVYAQVWTQNRTKRQQTKIGLFVGNPYRYWEDPYGTFDLHRTGGWNFPIIKEAYGQGWAETVGGFVNIDFHGTKISPNYNEGGDRQYKYQGEEESFFVGTGIDPQTNERYSGLWKGGGEYGPSSTPWLPYDPDPPDPFHYNQELITPHKFFGMGDGCVGIPTETEWSLNAGQRYSYHSINLTGITHPYLKTITGVIAEEVNKYTNGVEEFFKPGILGQHGDNYWDDFVTGWINTGDYAGESVHCLHLRTGYSTTPGSPKTKVYHWLGTGQFDVHYNFPYKGVDCLINHGPISPYPNMSKCCDLFAPPFNGWTGNAICYPTTTTTIDPSATTTTCDPYEMCTTTTLDPMAQYECDDGIKVTCPDGLAPTEFYNSEIGLCDWDMCTMAGCYTKADWWDDVIMWDSGIFPHERDWAERKHRQRNENPPRYWYGPYASTHFTFLYPNAQAVLDIHYPSGLRDEFPVTGFPEKITFDVEIEEYLVKDVVSGGYIDEDGAIVWDEILKSEEGGPAPSFTTGNSGQHGIPWNLVDENYVPLIERSSDWPPLPGETTPPYTKVPGIGEWHDQVVNYALANGRNFSTYDHPTRFDRGNQYATGVTYGYGTTTSNASYGQLHFPVGGFNLYSKYSFSQETTYARPTFTLNTLENNTTSLLKSLSLGNEVFYDCGGNGLKIFDPNLPLDEWGGGDQMRHAYDYYDPIYFMPMQSNLRETGVYNQGGLARENEPFTGTLVHPKQIYGDRWMGLRPQSVFSKFTYELESGYNDASVNSYVAGSPGDLITAETGRHGTHEILYNSEYDPTCAEIIGGWDETAGMGGGMWCGNISECYDTCTGVSGPPRPHEVRLTEHPCLNFELGDEDGSFITSKDNRVWLFNLDASGVDMHVRAPDCLSGYLFNVGDNPGGGALMGGTMSTPGDLLDDLGFGGGSLNSHAATAALGFRITGTSMLWSLEEGAAVPTEGNKQIDFFKPGWVQDHKVVSYNGAIYEKEGILYEKPSDEGWKMGEDAQGNVTGYETLLRYGTRMAVSAGSSGPQNKLRVSGWKETSRVAIKLSNFEIANYGAFPHDSYFSMEESGNAMVTGRLDHVCAAEASIYSEGIVLEDKSDDPLRDVLDYPHYASPTIKRPGVELPSGNYIYGEYTPDEEVVPMKHISLAPSRMMVRKLEWFIMGTGQENYFELFKGEPHFYNRYIWPTRSDMSQWNGGTLSWESSPPVDAVTYPLTELMISAQAGQPTPDKAQSEFIQRNYALTQHIAFYDGVVLDPTINKEWRVDLDIKFSVQPKTSYFVAQGTSVLDVMNEIVPAAKQTLWEDGSDSSEGGEEGVVGIISD